MTVNNYVSNIIVPMRGVEIRYRNSPGLYCRTQISA